MIYAVITGDIIESSLAEKAEKNALIKSLKKAFKGIKQWDSVNENSLPKFDVFRGDSFQGVMANPCQALRAAIFIRSAMRKNQPVQKDENWDVRLAIGLGTIDHLPENVSEGDGPAYRNSGPIMDELKGDYKTAITTPWEAINKEFKASSALLDAVISKWTAQQSEIIWYLLRNEKAKDIAEELDISQAAVHYRVKGSAWFAIEKLLQRYEQIIEQTINSEQS